MLNLVLYLLKGYVLYEVIIVNYKSTLLATLGGTVIGAGMGGKKGLEKGMSIGIKIGFVAGVTAVFVGSKICLAGKCVIEKMEK